MRCVSRYYLHWASALQRLACLSSRVVRQAMPGALRWEGDTRLSDLLVAESEPDHDRIPGLPDIHPGVRSADFGTFLQRRVACLQAESGLRGVGGGAAGSG